MLSKLIEGVETLQISPITSPVGMILQYAVTAGGPLSMELKRIIDWQFQIIYRQFRESVKLLLIVEILGNIMKY